MKWILAESSSLLEGGGTQNSRDSAAARVGIGFCGVLAWLGAGSGEWGDPSAVPGFSDRYPHAHTVHLIHTLFSSEAKH